jgi:hypothetical protein
VSQDVKAQLEKITLTGRHGQVYEFTGRQLGFSSSYVDQHNHATHRTAQPGERCSACRWFSVAIYRSYRESDTGSGLKPHGYVVHTVGGSSIPGEKRFSRVTQTTSAYEILEVLTVRRSDAAPFMTPQSARALAQAADVDDAIREAYVNRAVV